MSCGFCRSEKFKSYDCSGITWNCLVCHTDSSRCYIDCACYGFMVIPMCPNCYCELKQTPELDPLKGPKQNYMVEGQDYIKIS